MAAGTGPVAVVVDDGAAAGRLMDLALGLAADDPRPLQVVATGRIARRLARFTELTRPDGGPLAVLVDEDAGPAGAALVVGAVGRAGGGRRARGRAARFTVAVPTPPPSSSTTSSTPGRAGCSRPATDAGTNGDEPPKPATTSPTRQPEPEANQP